MGWETNPRDNGRTVKIITRERTVRRGSVVREMKRTGDEEWPLLTEGMIQGDGALLPAPSLGVTLVEDEDGNFHAGVY